IPLLRVGATPYLSSHLSAMIERVDDGKVGAQTLDTGLMDPETRLFLDDMIETIGLDAGLQATRSELENRTIDVVLNHALILRWGLLLSCVALMLGIFFWHQVVAQEMISLLKLLG